MFANHSKRSPKQTISGTKTSSGAEATEHIKPKTKPSEKVMNHNELREKNWKKNTNLNSAYDEVLAYLPEDLAQASHCQCKTRSNPQGAEQHRKKATDVHRCSINDPGSQIRMRKQLHNAKNNKTRLVSTVAKTN